MSSKGRPTNHIKTTSIAFEVGEQIAEEYIMKNGSHEICPNQIIKLKHENCSGYFKCGPIDLMNIEELELCENNASFNVDVGTQTYDYLYKF